MTVLAIAAATASPAAGTLGEPDELSPSGEDAFAPRVAIAANGDEMFVWRRFDGTNWRIQARARSAAGTLTPVQTVSRSGQDAEEPRVAIDADGDAVFAWQTFDGSNFRIETRARSAPGVLGGVETLSGPGQNATEPEVAVDPTGNAVFTWTRSDGVHDRVQARARTAGGNLDAVQTLSDAGENADHPAVAIDGDGDAVLTWRRFDGTNWRVQTRVRTAAGALSVAQTLSATGQNANDPAVGVSSVGDAVFAWRRFDDENFRVQARARSAAGTLAPVDTLSDAEENALSLAVAVNAGGDAGVIWTASDGFVKAATRSATGALGPVQTLSDAGGSNPNVAMDSTGDAVFAWTAAAAAPGGGSMSVPRVRTRNAAGVLSAMQQPGIGMDAHVAIDAGGDATAAWSGHDGANWRIQTATGPAEANFGPRFNLSAAGQHGGNPQVDVAADGTAVFTWVRFDGANWRIQAQARSAAGMLSPAQTLSAAGQDAFEPDVAVDATGDAVFSWRRFDGANWRVQTVARSGGGTLSAVQTLSGAGQDAFGPRIAVDPDGNGFLTWARFDGVNWRVQERVRGSGGVLTVVQNLSPAGQDAFDGGCPCRGPEVAVSTDADAAYVWRRFDGTNWRIQARARAAGGALSGVDNLSPAGMDADEHQVAAAANPSGDAVFAWTSPAFQRVQTRARSAAGALSAVQNLSPNGELAFSPRLAVDADGDAVFTWGQFAGENHAFTRLRTAAGALGATTCLADCLPAAQAQVAVDSGGNAVLAWIGADPFSFAVPIQAQQRDAAGSFRATETITSRPEPSGLALAVGVNGDAAAAWDSRDNEFNLRAQAAAEP